MVDGFDNAFIKSNLQSKSIQKGMKSVFEIEPLFGITEQFIVTRLFEVSYQLLDKVTTNMI